MNGPPKLAGPELDAEMKKILGDDAVQRMKQPGNQLLDLKEDDLKKVLQTAEE